MTPMEKGGFDTRDIIASVPNYCKWRFAQYNNTTMTSAEMQENVPLAPYTIYKIGGRARFFIEAADSAVVERAVLFARERSLPFFVLGAGSNVLVADEGFDGLVIHMTGGAVATAGEILTADAGVSMARLVAEAAKAGLGGIEWGIGIPGTVGGSVRGNAGCFGGEMAHSVERVRVLAAGGEAQKTFELANAECEFGYRNSVFKRHPEWIVLSAAFVLRRGDPAAIREKIAAYTKERLAKQDIGTQSCGCIFKNVSWSGVDRAALAARLPEAEKFAAGPNVPASFLIDRAGLKGARSGRAVISSRHANFFVNEGGATARDVAALIERAKAAVRDRYGIELEEEIQRIGKF